jgi:preprotein translocase subunit SecA
LYHRDKDYVVKDGEVIIVDEHTGRLMFGRRYSEGLHQAIEAKENVKIQQESKTLATVSLQNYFRMYEKLAGMTGTAATEAAEFKKIYNLEVLVVPTHRPTVRGDHPDRIYKTQRAKMAAIVEEAGELHRRGQPVLLGTRSIEINEILSEFLKRKKVPHNVLNAKNHEREAAVLAEAGRKGAVTVATNMAGRGVDIVLGGDPAGRDKPDWEKENRQVIDAGGLFVLGSERHESRRIDNQLRGRSGRQGDPGESRFYVSLEDEVMRIFGGDKIAGLMTTLRMPENEAIEHSLVSRAIEQAQTKVESWFFDQRKRVVEYDDVVNKQREIIYGRRRKILEDKTGEALLAGTMEKVEEEIKNMVAAREAEGFSQVETEQLVREFAAIAPFDDESQKRLKMKLDELDEGEKMADHLVEIARQIHRRRQEQLGTENTRELTRWVNLRTMDELWMEHLDALDDLREGIGLRGYAQQEPLVEYKKEAFSSFEMLLSRIDTEVARRIFRVQPAGFQPKPIVANLEFSKPEGLGAMNSEQLTVNREQDNQGLVEALRQKVKSPFGQKPEEKSAFASAFKQVSTNRPVGAGIVNKRKLGRNDPCWCGSGKKYKKCHYPN